MERREFLEWLVATGGIASLNRLGLHDLESIGREAHASAAQAPVLDAHASALVTAAAERIIPATATPGATQAGVTRFIETMLSGWYPAPDRERFVRGLAMLDERSRAVGGRDFLAMAVSGQEIVLQQFDDEVTALRMTTPAQASAHWFAMLKYLTVWGYCTSEVGMRETLRSWPPPMRYAGNVAVAT
jgi:hypothetical protein